MTATKRSRFRAWRLFRTAQSYQKKGAPRKAAAVYRLALEADPEDWGCWLWRGIALAECGEHDQARQHIERAAELKPSGAAPLLFLARAAYDAGRIEEARAALAHCLKKQENQLAGAFFALCLFHAGETQRAREILHGGLPFAPWLLGRWLAAIEEKAGAAPRDAAQGNEDADSAPARRGARQLRAGMVHLRAERWEKALAAFRSAAAALPGDARAAYGTGVSLYYLGRFEEAKQHLLPVLNRLPEPFSSNAKAALGRVALELGDFTEARIALRRVVAAGGAAPEDCYALGLAFLRAGRRRLAWRAFERCATPNFILERLAETSDPDKAKLRSGETD
ncbi:MAG TPA: tetratricopeptide repeat protein [Bryobacterales bacterium]|nr:tetratricopeptide repeat protein [Bryobacterales bacterium]